MKMYSQLILLLLFSCQQKKDLLAEKENVKAVLLNYYDALKTRDIDKLKATTTADFILYENGEALNNDSTINFFRSFPKFTVQYKFDSLAIKVDKQSARVHYFKQAAFVLSDTVHMVVSNIETATFRKENDIWKLELLYTTKRK